jgi:hypothetical protein
VTPGLPKRVTAAVLLLGLVLLLPTLSFRMGVDQGAFAHLGAEILKGHWPYLETWESDYPGMMFLQALEILLFGKSIVMFRVFDLLVQLTVVFFIFRITVWVGSRAGGLLAVALYCLTYQGYGPWNTAQREGFAMPFVLWGFWVFLTADRRSIPRSALWIGLGLGLAATFKPTMLALGLFYLPVMLSPRQWNRGAVVAAAAGLLAPAVVTIGFYASVGGMRELFEATVSYQAIYTARLRGDRPLLAHWLNSASRLGRQAGILAVGYAPLLLLERHRRERWMLYLAYLGAMLGVVVQGTFAGYHYLPGLAVGSVLVGSTFAQAFEWLRIRWAGLGISRHELGAAVVLILAALPVYLHRSPVRNLLSLQFLHPPAPGEFRIGAIFDFTESYSLARYLNQHTAPADRVLVWGYEPLVYYLSNRRAASRFGITHPLVMRAPGHELVPMQRRWRAEFMRDMAERKPRYVAVVQHDDWWWAPGQQSSEELLDDFPEWKVYLRRSYQLEQTIGRFQVYRRTEGPDAQ